jgi:molybdopterin molybdotransferase
MPEFLELMPPREALVTLIEHLVFRPIPEEIPTEDALDRVTYQPVLAEHPLPSFPRSTVDGYAVRAADTHGASDSLPAYLSLAGEVPMGAEPGFTLSPGKCGLIYTGGMLPSEADAVVMVEHTQSAAEGEVEVLRAVAVGENVLKVGEDVSAGEVVIPAGAYLRPAEIGGAMALGITRLAVARKPRVGILSSGDEVVPPDQEPLPGQVRDVNTYTLSTLVQQSGGEPVRYGIIPDREDALQQVAGEALAACDLVVVTAGSSASTRDLTARVIQRLGEPGVLVHGVNVRPGKPTILAACGGKAVIGLPGNPVSTLVIASLFVTPLVESLLGLKRRRLVASVTARLKINLPSQSGREDWVAVRLVIEKGQALAEPVFGKSNLIFTLARADGLVCIPSDANGLAAGAQVDVILM